MATFIVTAKKLNKRTAIPFQLPDPANIAGCVYKDYVFEGVEASPQEMPPTVIEKWYKDRDGYFYWGGGVNELREGVISPDFTGKIVQSVPLEQTDYKVLLRNIPDEWIRTNGKAIKVAILDTGFFLDHQDLVHLKNKAVLKDFGGNGNTNDVRGHGTHILGMLGAKTSFSNGVIGLIPEASFYLYKVVRDGVGFLDQFVKDAIEDAVSEGVDIINMSFNVPSKEGSILHTSIINALDKNIIMVASSGENDDLIQETLVFPAQFEKVISVGEVDKEFSNSLHTSFNPELDFIMPFINQRSCWINDESFGLYRNLKGSSMASALVTAVMAMSISFKNRNGTPVSDLKAISASFTNSGFDESVLKIFKV